MLLRGNGSNDRQAFMRFFLTSFLKVGCCVVQGKETEGLEVIFWACQCSAGVVLLFDRVLS